MCETQDPDHIFEAKWAAGAAHKEESLTVTANVKGYRPPVYRVSVCVTCLAWAHGPSTCNARSVLW